MHGVHWHTNTRDDGGTGVTTRCSAHGGNHYRERTIKSYPENKAKDL